MSTTKEIQLDVTTHREVKVVLIKFTRDTVLEDAVRKVSGVKWSKTHTSWYAPYSVKALNQIKSLFDPISKIDADLLKEKVLNQPSTEPYIPISAGFILSEEAQRKTKNYTYWLQSRRYSATQATGNKISTQNFGSIIESNNSGFILFTGLINTLIVGSDTMPSNSGSLDFLLTQYDNNGNVLWNKYFGGASQEASTDVHCNNDIIYLTGRTMSDYNIDTFNIINKGGGDVLIVKLKSRSLNTNTSQEIPPLNTTASIYPNPTSDQFFIQTNATYKLNVDLYDVNGRHVFSASVIDKSNINVATLDNGAYTLTIKTADRVINKKLIILR